jgi:hypothetical protein
LNRLQARHTFAVMGGRGSRGVIGVEAPDPVLSLVSSLGLALIAGTSLVVDLEGGLVTRRTLGDLTAHGPSREELSPGRTGVALISGRGVDESESATLIETLSAHWPAVVVRCRPGQWEGPTVPVRPLIPGLLGPPGGAAAVWQPLVAGMRPPGSGPVLPVLKRGTTVALLGGQSIGRSRWVRAWSEVWGLPWA